MQVKWPVRDTDGENKELWKAEKQTKKWTGKRNLVQLSDYKAGLVSSPWCLGLCQGLFAGCLLNVPATC